MMKKIDTDGDGTVDFEEFKAWFFKQDMAAQERIVVVHYQDHSGAAAETTMDKLPSLLAGGGDHEQDAGLD